MIRLWRSDSQAACCGGDVFVHEVLDGVGAQPPACPGGEDRILRSGGRLFDPVS